MPLKSVVAFYLVVSLVCTVINCRPRDDGVKNVKGAKVLPPAFNDGDGSGEHVAAGSGSTVDGSVSGSHVIQESSEPGRVSDTLTPGIRGDAGDHEAGLGGISTTGGLGIEGNAEPGAGSTTGLHGSDSSGDGSHGISGNTGLGGSGVAGSHGLGGNGNDGFLLGGAHGGSGDSPKEFQIEDAGALDGSVHDFGIVDSTTEETSTFSGSSSEVYFGMSSASEVDSINNSDSGIHAGSGSQPGVSDSGSSFSLSHSSSGSEVKSGKRLPVGVKG